jgi:hypothetical protein
VRRDSPRPISVPALVRGAVAQQQVRAGTALAVAEEADAGVAAGIEAALPPVHADDAAAAADGVPLNGVYRNGDNFVVRTV